MYYIYVTFYDESAHEEDWCIISSDNEPCLSEALTMLFNSVEEAKNYLNSDKGKEWKNCKFEIRKSVYGK